MTESSEPGEDPELERLREQKAKRYLRVARAQQKGNEYPEKPVDLTTADSPSFLKRYPLAVLEFWAGWCKPCKKLRPVLDELADEFWGDIAFGRISLDQETDARERFEVTVLPTVLLFNHGFEVERFLGGLTHSRLLQALSPFAKAPEAKVTRIGSAKPPGAIGG